jgi:hypothetical protein
MSPVLFLVLLRQLSSRGLLEGAVRLVTSLDHHVRLHETRVKGLSVHRLPALV